MKKFILVLLVSFLAFSMTGCITYFDYVPSSDAHVINKKFDVVGDVSTAVNDPLNEYQGAHSLLLQAAKLKFGEDKVDDVISIQATRVVKYLRWWTENPIKNLIFEGKAIKYTD